MNKTIKNKLIELGKEHTKRYNEIVSKWEIEHPNFVGFGIVDNEEMLELEAWHKQSIKEILKSTVD